MSPVNPCDPVDERAAAGVSPTAPYIDIVFDGPPGPVCGRLVEVEDAAGKSISVGEWIDRGGGLWALRIPHTVRS